MKPHWTGVFPASTTQMHKSGVVDLDATARHAEVLIALGEVKTHFLTSKADFMRPCVSWATLLCLAWILASSASAEDAAGGMMLGELNCTACHAATQKQAAWLSPKVAPKLQDVGSRASAEWLKKYLASPNEAKRGATMPDLLHGNEEQAEALTHYLLSISKPNVHRVSPDKAAVARGENLFHSVGCVACHAPQNGAALPAVFVALPHMAEKWGHEGLRRFLLDPLASRPSGRMPSMHLADGEASDIAHYLLRETKVPAAVEVAFSRERIRGLEDLDTVNVARTAPASGIVLEKRERGGALRFTTWLNIEQAGDYTLYLTAMGASRLSINGEWVMGAQSWKTEKVKEKHTLHLDAGRHELKVDFVQRGPKASSLALEWEGPGIAREVLPASRLSSEREPVVEPLPFVVDAAKVEQGRALYASMNCAVCHEQKPSAQPAPMLAALDASLGCLAEKPSGKAMDYHLNPAQRTALRDALTQLNTKTLAAPSPEQRVAHTMATFRCTACHVRDGVGGVSAERNAFFTSNVDDLGDEGRLPPRLDGVGDKLRPEWLAKLLGEGVSVRPYVNTRMPAFGAANVGHLAELFVALDRHASPLASVSDKPEAQRDEGRRLAGTNGLSCIVCHRFNRQPAHTMQVFDLINVTERLNEDWFRRFLRDPNKFNPGTRMLPLWPGGRSLIPAVLEGDTDRQHAALWTYLADGAKAKFPEGLSRQNMELIVGGEAVVYRGKLWEAGFRAIATGYPGGVNVAFDAEEMRLALVWRGRFLNVSPHWSVQGMGKIHPLDNASVVLPHGSPFAVLTSNATPWPSETSKDLGMKFIGYRVDALKRPTLLYRFGEMSVEDFVSPVGAGLHRTIKFSAAPSEGMHLRLASGKLSAAVDGAWRLNDALTIKATGAFVRGDGAEQELLAPLKTTQIDVDYVW